MVPHDVCYSIENIGYNVVRTDPVTFCNNSLGGKYNKETQNCEDIPFPGEMTNKTVTMNVSGAYKDIFGECDGEQEGDKTHTQDIIAYTCNIVG